MNGKRADVTCLAICHHAPLRPATVTASAYLIRIVLFGTTAFFIFYKFCRGRLLSNAAPGIQARSSVFAAAAFFPYRQRGTRAAQCVSIMLLSGQPPPSTRPVTLQGLRCLVSYASLPVARRAA